MNMRSDTNSSPAATKKSVSFGETNIIKAVEEGDVRSLPPKHVIWWQAQELDQILTADLEMLSRVGDDDDQRGLEFYLASKDKSQRKRMMNNTVYARSVVQRYRMLSRINGFLPLVRKDKSLQKFCTKRSRQNQIQAMQLAKRDAEDAQQIQQQQQQQQLVLEAAKKNEIKKKMEDVGGGMVGRFHHQPKRFHHRDSIALKAPSQVSVIRC